MACNSGDVCGERTSFNGICTLLTLAPAIEPSPQPRRFCQPLHGQSGCFLLEPIKQGFHDLVHSVSDGIFDVSSLGNVRHNLEPSTVPEGAKKRHHFLNIATDAHRCRSCVAGEYVIPHFEPLLVGALGPASILREHLLLLPGYAVVLRISADLAARKASVSVARRRVVKDVEAARAVKVGLAVLAVNVLLDVLYPSEVVAKAKMVLVAIFLVEGTSKGVCLPIVALSISRPAQLPVPVVPFGGPRFPLLTCL